MVEASYLRKPPFCAVVCGEIIQEPDRGADPETLLVGDAPDVAMQRLNPVGIGIGRARVQTAEFELRAQNVRHTFENPGYRDDPLEERTPIDKIREPPRLRFLLEFGARAFALFREKFFDTAAHCIEQCVAHEALKDQVSLLVKLPLLVFVHVPLTATESVFSQCSPAAIQKIHREDAKNAKFLKSLFFALFAVKIS